LHKYELYFPFESAYLGKFINLSGFLRIESLISKQSELFNQAK